MDEGAGSCEAICLSLRSPPSRREFLPSQEATSVDGAAACLGAGMELPSELAQCSCCEPADQQKDSGLQLIFFFSFYSR